MLIYSIEIKSTFEGIKSYWYPEVLTECQKDVIICLCANKVDLFEIAAVSPEEGKAFAKSINAYYVETSAKTSIGIEKLFQYIIAQLSNINPNAENQKYSVIEERLLLPKETTKTDTLKKCNTQSARKPKKPC